MLYTLNTKTAAEIGQLDSQLESESTYSSLRETICQGRSLLYGPGRSYVHDGCRRCDRAARRRKGFASASGHISAGMQSVLKDVAGLSDTSASNLAGQQASGLTLSEMYGRGMIESGDVAKLASHADLMSSNTTKADGFQVGGTSVSGAAHTKIVDTLNAIQSIVPSGGVASQDLLFKASFNQGQGSQTDASRFVDSSSAARQGTPANGAKVVDAGGAIGQVAQFDGTNDRVKYAATGLQNSDAKSTFAWIKADAKSSYERIVQDFGAGQGQFQLTMDSYGSSGFYLTAQNGETTEQTASKVSVGGDRRMTLTDKT